MGNGSYWDGSTWSNVQVDSPFDKAKVFVLSEAPVEPTPMRTGDLFIDTETRKVQFRNGTSWTDISAGLEVINIGDVTGLSDALDLKAPTSSPTFTGTVSGITKDMVGLANVDNTSDVNKPVSTAQQSALDLKANINSPTFTGTVAGITKSMVGLANVDNTSDASKPISTATQNALDLKSDTTHTHSVLTLSDWPAGLTVTELGYLNGVTSSVQNQLNGKQAAGSYAAASHTHTKSQITDFAHTHVSEVWSACMAAEKVLSTAGRYYSYKPTTVLTAENLAPTWATDSLVIPESGMYIVTQHLGFTNDSTTGNRVGMLIKNLGVDTYGSDTIPAEAYRLAEFKAAASSDTTAVLNVWTGRLAVNDKLLFIARSSQITNIGTSYRTFITLNKIGP